MVALTERAHFEKPELVRVADRVATAFVSGVLVLAGLTSLGLGFAAPGALVETTLAGPHRDLPLRAEPRDARSAGRCDSGASRRRAC